MVGRRRRQTARRPRIDPPNRDVRLNQATIRRLGLLHSVAGRLPPADDFPNRINDSSLALARLRQFPERAFINNSSWICHEAYRLSRFEPSGRNTWRKSMIKILAAIGLGSALMLAPALALADDAAPAAPAASTDTAKPMMKKPMMKKHHTTKHHTMKKKMTKPAAPAPDATPKT
jgi:hypothetical protein